MILEHELNVLIAGFDREIGRRLDIEGRQSSPMLRRIHRISVSHLTEASPRPAVRGQPFHGLLAAESVLSLSRSAAETGDLVTLRQEIQRAGQEIARQIMAGFYSQMDQSAADVGNVVDSRGGPLSADLICEMFERIDIDFDEHGNAIMPTFTFHPSAIPKVREILEDPAVGQRIAAIITRKKGEKSGL